jgi:hypothetical protein
MNLTDNQKIGGVVVLGIIALISLTFIFGWFGVGYTATVGKAQQNAETDVYYSSQAYIDGVAHDLGDLRLQYNTAKSSDEKSAIKSTIAHRYANFDKTKLRDAELQDFLVQMRQ